ncbi:hypothetical protein D1872_351090 [compost metagenome]
MLTPSMCRIPATIEVPDLCMPRTTTTLPKPLAPSYHACKPRLSLLWEYRVGF